MKTRTGGLRIGFRAGGSAWQKNLATLAGWAAGVGFELIDLGQVGATEIKAVKSAGADVISVDLLDWPALLSPDQGKRKACVAANGSRIRELASNGIKVFFAVIIPEDSAAELKDNWKRAVESYGELARIAESVGAAIV